MFDLVNDIASYPSFMNGCVGAHVIDESEEEILARLELSRMGFKQSFITRNELRPPESMKMQLVEGPFTRLSGEWNFKALSPSASKISFALEFEFDNGFIHGAASKVLEQIANELVDGVCQRAKHVYGT
jgi:ribosome-associated toxin RatA of RatAB toxin-antitoxin module